MIATLFDFDGVLVDSEPVHLEAFRVVARPLGITIRDEDYATKYLGLDDQGALRAILNDARCAFSESFLEELMTKKARAFMERFADALRVFEGAKEIVERRARVGTVGIVSGALGSEVRYGLERMGVQASVSFIVAAEECRACKPDPEGYLIALKKLGPATRAVVVEDSIAGVEAGKAAGLRVAAIAHSYAPGELRRAGADVVVPKIGLLSDDLLDGTE